MPVTIRDVARLAGVSVGTASNVLNGLDSMSQDKRLRVEAAVTRLGYRPNRSARSLAAGHSRMIGLIVTDVANPFFGLIIRHIQEEAVRHGYTVLPGISNDSLLQEQHLVDFFLDHRVEGVIIIPANESGPGLDHLRTLRKCGIPFVFCTASHPGFPADCVMTDLRKGSFLLTQHLLTKRCRDIRLLTGPRKVPLSALRIRGFRQAHLQAGISVPDNRIIETVMDFDHGYAATSALIRKKLPDAILGANDLMALGALKCLRDHRIPVPAKVSVAGYDDLFFSSVAETPLTTVRQPIPELCARSVDLLGERIRKKTKTFTTILLEPELIVRQSTRP